MQLEFKYIMEETKRLKTAWVSHEISHKLLVLRTSMASHLVQVGRARKTIKLGGIKPFRMNGFYLETSRNYTADMKEYSTPTHNVDQHETVLCSSM